MDALKIYTSNEFSVAWDSNKIITSLMKETGMSNDMASEIATDTVKIVTDLSSNIQVTTKLVRDIVNSVMLSKGYNQYRSSYSRVGMPIYDAMHIWNASGDSAHDNANLDSLNPETMHKHLADKLEKEAALLSLPKYISDLHIRGAIHLHDLDYWFERPFCMDSDLRYVLYYGLMADGVGTSLPVAKPANNPEVAVLHAAKALGCMQSCFAGGQGYQAFNVLMAPMLKNMSYAEIKQLAQMYIYEMSQMLCARGFQAVFSSIQMYPGVPKIWKGVPAVYRGKIWDGTNGTIKQTYNMFERETRLFFKALVEVLMDGDAWGKPFSFPKPEIVIGKEFIDPATWEIPFEDAPSYKELYRDVFKLTAKFGSPYFDNQIPSYRQSDRGPVCFQCCAYSFGSNDDDEKFADKMLFKDGEHFSLGSYQVISLNLPRAAYVANGDYDKLIEYLKQMVDVSIDTFNIKRSLIGNKPLPFAKQTPPDPNDSTKHAPPFVDVNGLSFVIGLVGLNELVQTFTGKQMHESGESWKFGVRVVTELEIYVKSIAAKNNMKIALARTPAETTAQRFAVADILNGFKNQAVKVVKGDISNVFDNISDTKDLPVYYTNGTHLAVDSNVDIFTKIKLEEVFFPIIDGGNIFHIFMSEAQPDPDGIMDLCLRIATKTQIGYFAVTRDLTICRECNKVYPGLHDQCTFCGSKEVDQFSRITGYYQRVSNFNNGKKQELIDRHRYEI